MPFSKDPSSRPLVGELDFLGLPNVYIMNGFGPSGINCTALAFLNKIFLVGPMAGKLMSLLVSRDASITHDEQIKWILGELSPKGLYSKKRI